MGVALSHLITLVTTLLIHKFKPRKVQVIKKVQLNVFRSSNTFLETPGSLYACKIQIL